MDRFRKLCDQTADHKFPNQTNALQWPKKDFMEKLPLLIPKIPGSSLGAKEHSGALVGKIKGTKSARNCSPSWSCA